MMRTYFLPPGVRALAVAALILTAGCASLDIGRREVVATARRRAMQRRGLPRSTRRSRGRVRDAKRRASPIFLSCASIAFSLRFEAPCKGDAALAAWPRAHARARSQGARRNSQPARPRSLRSALARSSRPLSAPRLAGGNCSHPICARGALRRCASARGSRRLRRLAARAGAVSACSPAVFCGRAELV